MKKLVVLFVLLVAFTVSFSQSNSGFNYQAVIRNTSGIVVANKQVNVRLSILQGSTNGSSVCAETFLATTNEYGIVNLQVGSVNKSTFDAINWGDGPYFLKVDMDVDGGSDFVTMGTSQLLSVPFALYAKSAGVVSETDPVFNAHASKSITSSNISNWNTSYSWGNHADAGYMKNFEESDPYFENSAASQISNLNINNWNIAFNWGNHANAGYLRSYTETDPTFTSHPAKGISNSNISNWDEAYAWGNHAEAGYLKSFEESDPYFENSAASQISSLNIDNWNTAFTWGDHANAGYLKSYTETDPIFTSHPAMGISNSNISNWNDAYAWGNHANAGYLKNYTETDPIFATHPSKSISNADIVNWNSSYSWGNHALAGYLKSYSETDPTFASHPAKNISSTDLVNWNAAFAWGNHANAGYLKSFTEADPTFNAHPSKNISSTNISNWDAAYSWGNHQGLYRPISYVPSWTEVTNKPAFSAVATSGDYDDLSNKPTGTNVGDMQYWNGTEWVAIPVGQPGQYLQLNASGIPAWSGVAYASVSTVSATSITQTAAVSGGNVTSDGGSTITARGVCWSISANPTIANSKTTDGSGTGSFTSNISGLNAGTTYYVRAYATNSSGTVYGTSISFTTTAQLATVTTGSASLITTNTATIGGNVTASGSSSVTERGVCYSTTGNPTTSNSKIVSGSGTGSFSCNLSGLSANTAYHVRAFATNSGGTAYGADVIFTTEAITVVDNTNLLLGNPSNATADIAKENNYLMEKPQYTLSYNNSKLIPNWTSWHLYSGDIGSTARQDNFRADTDLPSGWYRVGSSDFQYATYGFDRGHMCPSADRTSTVADNSATFLMTNMIPQAPNNNQQTWQNLETYARTLIDAGNELYIISGPYGQGGSSAKGTFNSISVNSGANAITVPNKTWKILVVLSNGDNDLSRITTTTRVIAVVMPNDQTCNSKPWYDYRVSVDSLESLTGYDFLSNVSTTIQNVIEASVDNVAI